MGGPRVIAVKHNCPQIRDKLERIKKLVDGGWQDDVVNQMTKARNLVRRLTPKSKTAGSVRIGRRTKRKPQKTGHLRDGWAVKTIGRGGKDRVSVLSVVYNKHTHTAAGKVREKALMRSASGDVKNYTLLDILEYGSRAHKIYPAWYKSGRSGGMKQGGLLRFETSTGEVVYARSVSHPGTKPHGMVRLARAKLVYWLKKLQARWKKKIEGEWGR